MKETFVQVDRSSVINDNFAGCCAVYHGFAYMPQSEEAGLVGEALDREFRRVENARLPIARTWFRPDFNQDRMRRLNRWLEKMQQLNVEVAVNAGQWFTRDVWYFAHENFNNPAFTANPDNFNACCDKYAAWMSKAVEYWLEVKKYTHIKYLCLFSEGITYQNGGLPRGMTQMKAYEICCRKLHEKLIEYGLREKIKLVGPGGNFTSHRDEQLKYAVDRMNDVLDIFSGHTYARFSENAAPSDFGMIDYDGWLNHARWMKKTAARTGKPVWMDEYGMSGGQKQAEAYRADPLYGNFLGQAAAAFANGRLNASFLFTLFDQKTFWNITNEDSYYNGVHRWGLASMPGDDVPQPGSVRPAWYAFTLLSRFLSDGHARVFETRFGKEVCAAATQLTDGSSTILVVNRTAEAVSVTVEAGTAGLRGYLYDPAAVCPQQECDLLPAGDPTETETFTVTLPPYAAAIYHG